MLKKEFCQRCINGCARYKYGWVDSDERNWKEGIIWCPYEYIKEGENAIRDKTKQPPKDCPYFLEHVIC